MKSHVIPWLVLGALFTPFGVNGSVLWRGNFETGDARQWQAPINGAGATVTGACHFDGNYAGRVRINGDASFVWNGNKDLDRSEFHHRRAAGTTSEGHDTYFAFAFYLPRAFSEHKHDLGYWESDQSWHQMFRFTINGTALGFQQSASNRPFWTLTSGATPGRWHRVALRIHWSVDAKSGFTHEWVDGRDMGRQVFATLPSGDAWMFTQIGILRTQEDNTEEIYIDGALETDTLAELIDAHASAASATPCPW